jgi:hypothetical protein
VSEQNLWEVARVFPRKDTSAVPILGNVATESQLDEVCGTLCELLSRY